MEHIRLVGLQYGGRVIDDPGSLRLAFSNDGPSAKQADKFTSYLREQRADFVVVEEQGSFVLAWAGQAVFTVRSAPPARHTMRTVELAWERRGGVTAAETLVAKLLFGPEAKPLEQVMDDVVNGPGPIDAERLALFSVLAAVEASARPGVVELEVLRMLGRGRRRAFKETDIERLVEGAGVESDDSVVDVLFRMVLSGAIVWFNSPGDPELRYRLQPRPPLPPICACGRERARFRRPNGSSPSDPALICVGCWAQKRSPQREELYRSLGGS
jgi:hypothetical protein